MFEVKDLSAIRSLTSYPATWEGAVMRMSDKVAYLGRDLEDAVQLGLVKSDRLPPLVPRVLGSTNSDIIDTLVNDVIATSRKSGAIGFSDPVFEAVITLRDFNYRMIYLNPILASYHSYFRRILVNLFSYLEDLFSRFGPEGEGYREEGNRLSIRFGDFLTKMRDFYEKTDGSYDNAVTDYIAGMTDGYAIDCISEIMIPKKFELEFDEFLFREEKIPE